MPSVRLHFKRFPPYFKCYEHVPRACGEGQHLQPGSFHWSLYFECELIDALHISHCRCYLSTQLSQEAQRKKVVFGKAQPPGGPQDGRVPIHINIFQKSTLRPGAKWRAPALPLLSEHLGGACDRRVPRDRGAAVISGGLVECHLS